ncbi:hypothetical protein ACHMW7_16280 [Aminobacter sp. UC22_36]|uniref:hypothetical protein n=1 Tax=Aminobacter sp. UC22_36 TaxID=3374549 RepID=UPI003757389A
MTPMRYAAIILAILTGPAWADCAPKSNPVIPSVLEQPYPEARGKLIAAGWQPFLDQNQISNPNPPPFAEEWIAETGFFEVEACSGTGRGFCKAVFVDKNKNWLRVITAEGAEDEHVVDSTSLVCGPDD